MGNTNTIEDDHSLKSSSKSRFSVKNLLSSSKTKDNIALQTQIKHLRNKRIIKYLTLNSDSNSAPDPSSLIGPNGTVDFRKAIGPGYRSNTTLSQRIEMFRLASDNDFSLVMQYDAEGFNVVTTLDENGMNVLGYACKYHNKELIKYFIDNGADTNISYSRLELSPLMQFITNIGVNPYNTPHDTIDLLKYLLNNGADPNVTDKHGNSALMLFCASQSFSDSELLVEDSSHNVSVAPSNIVEVHKKNEPYDLGETFILHLSKYIVDINHVNKLLCNPLLAYIVSTKNPKPRIIAALVKCGVDIHYSHPISHLSVLMYAARMKCSRAVLETLFKCGANVYDIDIETGRNALLEYLTVFGPEELLVTSYPDPDSHTRPLALTMSGIEVDTTRFLCHRVGPQSIDKYGFNALMTLFANDFSNRDTIKKACLVDIVEAAISSGVDVNHSPGKLCDIDWNPILLYFALHRCTDGYLLFVLFNKGAELTCRLKTQKNLSLILLAAEHCCPIEIFSFLIDHGADVNDKDSDGYSVLDKYLLNDEEEASQVNQGHWCVDVAKQLVGLGARLSDPLPNGSNVLLEYLKKPGCLGNNIKAIMDFSKRNVSKTGDFNDSLDSSVGSFDGSVSLGGTGMKGRGIDVKQTTKDGLNPLMVYLNSTDSVDGAILKALFDIGVDFTPITSHITSLSSTTTSTSTSTSTTTSTSTSTSTQTPNQTDCKITLHIQQIIHKHKDIDFSKLLTEAGITFNS